MQNIPVFTTPNGVGSLILREIPYNKTAYIKIESSLTPQAFLEECLAFCKTVGAETIYTSGHDACEAYPFHTAIWLMGRDRAGLANPDACLFPVTEKTIGRWLQLYNDKMQKVPNSAHKTFLDGKKILAAGSGYFVHKDGLLLGIGMAAGEKIDMLASFQPGAGQQVLLALNQVLSGDRVVLEVASKNEKAVQLYERMGFIKISELRRWYKIL